MTELAIGDQHIRFDREATIATYQKIPAGFCTTCPCAECRNYLAQRQQALPPSFRQLLVSLGIDETKESEMCGTGPLTNDLYSYDGWFPLVGELVVAGEQNVIAPDSPAFEYFFRKGAALSPEFQPSLSLEVFFQLPWVLDPTERDSPSGVSAG